MAGKQTSWLAHAPPGVRPLLLLAGIAGAVAVGITIFFWWRAPQWTILVGSVGADEVPAIVQALEASHIGHKLDPSSGAVLVSSTELDAARLELAAQGLPKSDAGFNLMRDNPGFGVSQFMETARYQYAIETELARTIMAVDAVAGARVHLALPRPSPFVRERRPGSASVMVQLKGGRQLESDQVAAITHLVASSVPELEPEQVTIVDQKGRLLSAPGRGDTADGEAAFEIARRLEGTFVERIETLLTPLVGQGRVRAQVVVDLDAGAVEEAREQYRPDSAIVRSETTSETQNTSGAIADGGVPGALTNQPPPAGVALAPALATAAASGTTTAPGASGPTSPAPAPGAAGAASGTTAVAAATAPPLPSASSREATRNFEMDRTVSYMKQPPGRVRRVSVAVLVDEARTFAADGKETTAPLTAQQITEVTQLVKDAVGFDATRGDSVNVMNARFVSEGPVEAPAAVPIWQRPFVIEIGRTVLGALLLIAVVFGLLKPLLRSLLTPPRQFAAAGAGAAAAAVVAGPVGVPPLAQPGMTAALQYEQQLTQARQLVAQDPKRVAQVVKTWVASDE
jgi:flagellar M-ring protein FliF